MENHLRQKLVASHERHLRDETFARCMMHRAESLFKELSRDMHKAPPHALRVVAHAAHACSLPLLRPTLADVLRDLECHKPLQQAFFHTVCGLRLVRDAPPLARDEDWEAWITTL